MPGDGVLFVAFGGPTPGCCRRFDPCPGSEARCFVRAVVGERPGAEARIAEVVAHYEQLGGFSPFQPLTLKQVQGVAARLAQQGLPVPVRVGMRYWPPYIAEALQALAALGCRRLVVAILSAFQSPASWDVYQRLVAEGLAAVAPEVAVTYLDPWYEEAGFVTAWADHIRQAYRALAPLAPAEVLLVYTAHALPVAMAAASPYVQQFTQAAAAVARCLGQPPYRLAYQSQASGTGVPWLQPDVNDALRQAKAEGYRGVVVAPLGFLCDHVEVLYDLDVEAQATARACGLAFARAPTVGTHPAFLAMLSERLAACLRAA
ncbi:MAG: ferrochelatase [Candidatus Tectimicrobiota bacterium]|nr:MAG: ferrochelatase [Candidatus Tectomicrobia bacterium]